MKERKVINDTGREPLAFPDAETVNSLIDPLGTSPAPRIVGTVPVDAFPPEFLSIDANLATDPDFDAKSVEDTATQFQFWQMESLADQAADLLDRCATERAAYDDLRSKWAKLILDVVEFEQTEKIHDQEIAAGWYTINHDQSSAELEALKAMLFQPNGHLDPQPKPPFNLGALLVPRRIRAIWRPPR